MSVQPHPNHTEPNLAIQPRRFRSGLWETHPTRVISEMPVGITINGVTWLTLMATPTHLEALAVGFAYNEGIIQSLEEVADVRVCPAGDNVDLWLHHAAAEPKAWRRTSGCAGGLTAAILEREVHLAEVAPNEITPAVLLDLMGQLYAAQDLYHESGGVHSSALADGQRLLVSAEDIGRHNTLDKLAGRMLLEKVSARPLIALTTGRISSEMLQKAARIGTPLVLSRTSPSSFSVQLAAAWGMTLVGYARRDQFSIYTHPERIASSELALQAAASEAA